LKGETHLQAGNTRPLLGVQSSQRCCSSSQSSGTFRKSQSHTRTNGDGLLLVCSLVSAIVRKLTLATTYAAGLYIHFLINLIVAIYLLFVILHTTHTDTVTLCQNVLKNQQSKDQCNSIFDSIRRLYAGIASFILIVELCE
jgi:hypothetical protein